MCSSPDRSDAWLFFGASGNNVPCLVLRTGKKAYRKPNPTMATSLPKDSEGKSLGYVPEIRYDMVDLPSWDFVDKAFVAHNAGLMQQW